MSVNELSDVGSAATNGAKSTQQARDLVVERALRDWRGDLEGRVAVITGAARGIGKVMADGLIQAGAKVVAVDRTWDGADAQRRPSRTRRGWPSEPTSPATPMWTMHSRRLSKTYGGADILINNAASGVGNPLSPDGTPAHAGDHRRRLGGDVRSQRVRHSENHPSLHRTDA